MINIIELAKTEPAISVQSIQPRYDNAFNQMNKIRLAWKLQITESEKQKMMVLSQEVKHALYRDIDNDVRERYIKLLREYMKAAIADGAQLRLHKDGWPVIDAEYQIDCDVLLIHAATAVLSK